MGVATRFQDVIDPVPPQDVALLVKVADLESCSTRCPKRVIRDIESSLESSQSVEIIGIDNACVGIVGTRHESETLLKS